MSPFQERNEARVVDIGREPRQRWAHEVRINGRTYARCDSAEDAAKVAHALRLAGDPNSDSNRLSRIQSELRRLAELR